MRWITFLIIVLIATLLEAGNLLNWMAIGGWTIRPSILITIMVYYALSARPAEAVSCSFLTGLAADLATGMMGTHMICYGIAGMVLHSISHTLAMRRATHKALFVFLAYLLTETGAHWLWVLKTQETRSNIYSMLLLTGLYSAIISPLLWSILSSVSGWSKTTSSKTQRIYH